MKLPIRAGALAAVFLAGIPAVTTAAPEDQPIYAGVVQKIIDSKCVACHSAEKKKGKLEMTSLETVLKGGDSGKPTVVAGKSGESDLVRRIALPADDDDHMPPKDKPQVTDKELAVLKWWIDSGAKPDVLVKDAGAPDDLKPAIAELAAKTVEKPKAAPKPVTAPKDLDQPTKDAIAKLQQEIGATILQIAQSETGLMFTAVNVADKFGDAELAKFAPLAGSMQDLNLARTKVTDAGLAAVAGMKNLQRLRLENTAVTDAGLDHLKGLEKLEYLNLFNTAVTDAGLEKLAALKGLKRLYVWQTKATKEGAQKLHDANKNVIVNIGWDQEIGKPPMQPVVSATPAPTAPETKGPDPKDPEANFYDARIQPIFNRTCTACHGTEKKKGDYQMHTYELVLKGGKDAGAGVVPGKPDESSIVKRMCLPADDDDHMPPKDKKQPEGKEIGLVKWWIGQGADRTKKNKEVQVPAELN